VTHRAKLCLNRSFLGSNEESVSEEWFALYTKHQHEKSVDALLARKGFQTFLPLYRTSHRWSDRHQIVALPLFACYLFVRAELTAKVEILRTAGVRWLVENSGRACAIPDEDIETVRKVCVSGAIVQPHAFLKQGDLVRVRSGALTGIQGVLLRIKNECRVVVSVEPLRKSLSVEVDATDLERLPASDARAGGFAAFHATAEITQSRN
jgi:transcription antitermination factor NusG